MSALPDGRAAREIRAEGERPLSVSSPEPPLDEPCEHWRPDPSWVPPKLIDSRETVAKT
jgi:hypothetical protein